jgi:hypothetical protein
VAELFDVDAWRAKPLLLRLLIMAACRHKTKAEMGVIEDFTTREKPTDPDWMNAAIVYRCCRCGHVWAYSCCTTRDRTPGAMMRWVEKQRPMWAGRAAAIGKAIQTPAV